MGDNDEYSVKQKKVVKDHICEENPNPVLRISSDGKVLYANKASEYILRQWQLKEQKVPKNILHFVRNVIETETSRNVEIECGNQSYILEYVPAENSQYVNVYGFDITERKLVETNLRLTQFTIDNAGESIYWVTKDARYVYVNQTACRTLGYSYHQMLTMTIADIDVNFPGHNWPYYWNKFKEEKYVTIKTEHKHKDGHLIPVEICVNYFELENNEYLCCFARNISERKQYERKLNEVKQRFKTLTEHSSDWIWEVDKNGVYTYSSPKVKDLMGYEPEEVIGKTPFDFMPQDEKERIKKRFGDICEKKQPFRSLENSNISKDGKKVILETSGVPFFDENGNLLGYRGVDRDITERKQAEKQRKQLLLMLESRNRELKSFSSVIRHDIGNPLMSIEAFSRELSRTLKSMKYEIDQGTMDSSLRLSLLTQIDEKIKPGINYIDKSIKEINNLLEGFRHISKLGHLKLNVQKIDMNELVSEIIGSFKFQIQDAEAKVIQEYLPECKGDPAQIKQAFINLISNALKYTSDKRKPEIIITGRKQDEDTCIYSVKDNGPGIEKQNLEKVFDMFFRHQPFGPVVGEGLGLSIVKRIAQANKGRVWAESEFGKGATFFLEIPAPKP